MEYRSHPDSWRSYNRLCTRCLIFVGLAATRYGASFHGGGELFARVAMAVFSLSIFAMLLVCTVRLFRARCPECGASTRVRRDDARMEWMAECSECRIRWMLGTDAS